MLLQNFCEREREIEREKRPKKAMKENVRTEMEIFFVYCVGNW